MIGILKKCGYGFYLGFSLAFFADVYVYDWRFYAIIIPTVILVAWGYKK